MKIVRAGVFVGLALGVLAARAQVADLECVRVPQTIEPTWFESGAWSSSGDLLVLVDYFHGRLLRFSRAGERLSDLSLPGRGDLELNQPFEVFPTATGFILSDADFKWLALGREAKPERLLGKGEPWKLGVLSLALHDDELVGLGTARIGESSRQAFVRVRLGSMAVLAWSEEGVVSDAELSYYYAFGHLLAVAGDKAYAIRFMPRPRLEQLFPTRGLSSFPMGFEHPPTVPPRATSPGHHEEFEHFLLKSKLPVRLLGAGAKLYLLTREPRGAAGTGWLLHRIDPLEDRVEATLHLPTNAPHLTLIPGPERWALLSQSRVGPDVRRTFESMILIPAAWVTGHGSPLESDQGASQCTPSSSTIWRPENQDLPEPKVGGTL